MATAEPDLGEECHKNCSTCSCTNEASSFCPDCDKYFCATCLPVHATLLMGHTVLGSDQRSEWGKKKEEKKIWKRECKEHTGQMTCMYCSKHDIVCCPVCAVKKHGLGFGCYKTVSYIPDIAKGLSSSKEYRAHLDRIDKVTARFNASEQKLRGHTKLHDSKVKGTKVMRELIERIDKMLNELMNASLKKLESTVDGQEKANEKEIDECVTHAEELAIMKRDLGNAEQSDEVELFICMKTSQTQMDTLDTIIDALENKSDNPIKFNVDDEVEKAVKLLEKAASLGTIQSTTHQERRVSQGGDSCQNDITQTAKVPHRRTKTVHNARIIKPVQKTAVSSMSCVSTTSSVHFGTDISFSRSSLLTVSPISGAPSTTSSAHEVTTTVPSLASRTAVTTTMATCLDTTNATCIVSATGSSTVGTQTTTVISMSTPAVTAYMSGTKTIGKTVSSTTNTGASCTSSQTNNSSLLFHQVHGECVELSSDSKRAKGNAQVFGFSRNMGICFSNRPIATGERVYIKFEKDSLFTNSLKVGLTRTDPGSLNDSDPKRWISIGNLGIKSGDGLPKNTIQLYFYMTLQGDVFYGVDEKEMGWLFHGIDTNVPYWAIIDISGLGLNRSIEFINPSRGLEYSVHADQNATHTPAFKTTVGKHLLSDSKDTKQDKSLEHLQHSQCNVDSLPILIHSVCGKNVSVSDDQMTATRLGSGDTWYFFTTRPMACKETIVIEVNDIDEESIGGLYIGFTSCDPATLRPEDLPNQTYSLLRRAGYWALSSYNVIFDVGTMFHLYLTLNGRVQYCVKKKPPYKKDNHAVSSLMDVDISQPVWAFFAMDRGIQKIKIIASKDQAGSAVPRPGPVVTPTNAPSSVPSAAAPKPSLFPVSSSPSSSGQATMPGAAASMLSQLAAKHQENTSTAQTPSPAAPATTPQKTILGGFSFTSTPKINEPKAEKQKEEVKPTATADAPKPFSGFSFTTTTQSPAEPPSYQTTSTASPAVFGQMSAPTFGSLAAGGQTAAGFVDAAGSAAGDFKGFSGVGQRLFTKSKMTEEQKQEVKATTTADAPKLFSGFSLTKSTQSHAKPTTSTDTNLTTTPAVSFRMMTSNAIISPASKPMLKSGSVGVPPARKDQAGSAVPQPGAVSAPSGTPTSAPSAAATKPSLFPAGSSPASSGQATMPGAAASMLSQLAAKHQDNASTAQTSSPATPVTTTPQKTILGDFSFTPKISEPKAEKQKEKAKATSTADAPKYSSGFSKFHITAEFGPDYFKGLAEPGQTISTNSPPSRNYTTAAGFGAAAGSEAGDFKGFAGAGQSMFTKAPSPRRHNTSTGSDDHVDDYEPDVDFKPVVPLPDLVEVKTGEEDEEKMFGERAKLFRYDTESKQWKERGIGEIKILRHKTTNVHRILMRREQVLKLCANHKITEDLKLAPMATSEKAWVWTAADFSEGEVKTEKLAARFKNQEIAVNFKKTVEACQETTMAEEAKVDETKTGKKEEKKAEQEEKKAGKKEEKKESSGKTGSLAPLFKQKAGSWTCTGCYVPNGADILQCPCCNTMKPGVTIEDLPKQETPANTGSSGSSGFTFGSQQPIQTNPSGGFSLAPKPADSTSSQPQTGGFKFGSQPSDAAATSASQTGGFMFGSSTSTATSTAASASPFGKPAATTSTHSSALSYFKFGDQGTSSEAPKESASTSGSGFILPEPCRPSSGFTFGGAGNTTAEKSPAATSAGFNVNKDASKYTFGETSKPVEEKKQEKQTPDVSDSLLAQYLSAPDTKIEEVSSTTDEGKAKDQDKPVFGSAPASKFTFGQPAGGSSPLTFGSPSMPAFSIGSTSGMSEPEPEEQGKKPTTPVQPTERFKFSMTPKAEPDKYQPAAKLGGGFNFSLNMTPGMPPKTSPQNSSGLTSPKSPDVTDDGYYVNKEEDDIHFEPIIELPDKVEVKTGEEDEEVIFSHRAKLFRFTKAEWKERGLGDVKVLFCPDTNKARILMRREQILKLCCNHYVTPELKLRPMPNTEGKALIWYAMDFSDGEAKNEQFSIKFKTTDIANQFQKAIEEANERVASDIPVSSSAPGVETIGAVSSPGKPDVVKAVKQEKETSDDVIVVKEEKATPDEISRARALMLPDHFFLYRLKPICPGCRGCKDEEDTRKSSDQVDEATDEDHANNNNSEDVNEEEYEAVETEEDDDDDDNDDDAADDDDDDDDETDDDDDDDDDDDNETNDAPDEDSTTQAGIFAGGFTSPNPKAGPAKSESNSVVFRGGFVERMTFSSLAFQGDENKPFNWHGAGQQLFGGAAKPRGGDEGSGDEDGVEQGEESHFKPIVPLPKLIDVKTGEEDETKEFCQRARLYRFDAKWKEKGVGEMKILKHNETGKYRLLLRREQVHKLACNHLLTPDLNLQPMNTSEVAWCWVAQDYSENKLKVEKLAVRFKTIELAQSFKSKVDEILDLLREQGSSSETSRASGSQLLATLLSTGAGGDTSQTSNWPLQFHPIHGDNVELCNDRRRAKRGDSFCKGICFSGRPIAIGERVYLKFVDSSGSWSGVLRFGFTSTDPGSLRGPDLPSYACPDMINKPGNWAKALSERHAGTGYELFFYVTRSGDVFYGINGEEKGLFFSGVNTSGPLWTLFDIYGNTSCIEFINPLPQPLNNMVTNLVNKDVCRSPEIDDELSFHLTQDDEDSTTQAGIFAGGFTSPNPKAGPAKSESNSVVFRGGFVERMTFSSLAFQGDENKPFNWHRAGQQLFVGGVKQRGGGEGSGDEDGVEQGEESHFKPIVPLPKLIDVKTGEEDETKEFAQRARLYRFDATNNEWKEKGVGEMKILKHNETGKYRLLLRREQVHKLACNHLLTPDLNMQPMNTSEVALCWVAQDYSENKPKVEKLAVRFKTIELAQSFKNKVDEIQDLLREQGS